MTVNKDEGHIELEISDDPFDCSQLDVKNVPLIVTLNKVHVYLCENWYTYIYTNILQFYYSYNLTEVKQSLCRHNRTLSQPPDWPPICSGCKYGGRILQRW